jgi:hypothetical protein
MTYVVIEVEILSEGIASGRGGHRQGMAAEAGMAAETLGWGRQPPCLKALPDVLMFVRSSGYFVRSPCRHATEVWEGCEMDLGQNVDDHGLLEAWNSTGQMTGQTWVCLEERKIRGGGIGAKLK